MLCVLRVSSQVIEVIEHRTGSAGDGLPSTEPSVPLFVHRHIAGAESQPGGEEDVTSGT